MATWVVYYEFITQSGKGDNTWGRAIFNLCSQIAVCFIINNRHSFPHRDIVSNKMIEGVSLKLFIFISKSRKSFLQGVDYLLFIGNGSGALLEGDNNFDLAC